MRAGALSAAVTLLLVATTADASGQARTVRASAAQGGGGANAPARHPDISADGSVVAFDSAASDLVERDGNRARDIFLRIVPEDLTVLVSRTPDGAPANGDSRDPALAGAGLPVAFSSAATNLVPDDANASQDVFVFTRDGVTRVSVASDGTEADGPSFDPDISADGRYVVFASDAENLVPGDTNDRTDVFLHDRTTGTTRLLSRSGYGQTANGRSTTPAISPDGGFVTFASTATTLTLRDRNRAPDVFVADVERGTLERASVSSRGRQQNRGVLAPFTQVSDVSSGGRFVVFDSDADNLVRGDDNEDTDVFLRDRRRKVTRLVSRSAAGVLGDNDSFFPSITPNGAFVAFESFANNLTPFDGPGEDFFVVDVVARHPTLLAAPARGRKPKQAERLRQLLEAPALTSNGRFGVFTSSATNLADGDDTRFEDVFRRDLAPAAVFIRRPGATVRGRGRYRFATDEPGARQFTCSIDGRRFDCRRTGRLPALSPGSHSLRVRAEGPGLFVSSPDERRFRVRR